MKSRKDLQRMEHALRQVKNPLKQFNGPGGEDKENKGSTGVDLPKPPKEPIVKNKEYKAIVKTLQEIREKEEADKMTSNYIYNKGHSTNKKYEEASPDEKRSMIINREYDR